MARRLSGRFALQSAAPEMRPAWGPAERRKAICGVPVPWHRFHSPRPAGATIPPGQAPAKQGGRRRPTLQSGGAAVTLPLTHRPVPVVHGVRPWKCESGCR